MITISSRGFVALLTVIILSAALLAASVGASLFGLGELNLSYEVSASDAASSIGEGCLEETLLRLRRDLNYGVSVSPINLSLADGSCIINVSMLSPTSRLIKIQANRGDYFHYLTATSTLSGGKLRLAGFTDGE